MFGFLKKAAREMNTEAAREFWSWFEDREKWIIAKLEVSDASFVDAIDEKLKPVFPYFRRELEFQLGYNDGIGEFFFFHFGDARLQSDAEELGKQMPDSLKGRWQFICEA